MENLKKFRRFFLQAIHKYLPLLVVFLMALVMAFATHSGSLMNGFMGYFLCLLAMFKFFDLPGFTEGFQMYDRIAKRYEFYAYCYPFIELVLGLAFLSHFLPFLTNLVTLGVMIVSSIGIIESLREGLDVRCACLGTVLNVPLSTISVIETLGMSVMAFANLVARFT
jgi:uncharacterized membrane protein (UPF0182 family)